MDKIITKPALRVKVTGACNRTCNFCNEEGDMRRILSMPPNAELFDCIGGLVSALQLKRVMLTGGEPTIHPDLLSVVRGINCPDISVTTNGITVLSVEEWRALKEAGLNKVIISVHDATPQSFLQLETRPRQFGWAVQSLEAQKINMATASAAGLHVRVNTVAYGSQEQVFQVMDSLEELQRRYGFELRLLNDLANVEKSRNVIYDVCRIMEATEVTSERRAGSSSSVVRWETKSGFRFSTKMSFRYFFDPICSGCSIKSACHEGFYGVRLERRLAEYWVRLCIYKHSPDVLMPWRQFLDSAMAEEYKNLCAQEQLDKI
jgi:cyclic pyranopterin phosphate synthase